MLTCHINIKTTTEVLLNRDGWKTKRICYFVCVWFSIFININVGVFPHFIWLPNLIYTPLRLYSTICLKT